MLVRYVRSNDVFQVLWNIAQACLQVQRKKGQDRLCSHVAAVLSKLTGLKYRKEWNRKEDKIKLKKEINARS